jgi:hypothetical protein
MRVYNVILEKEDGLVYAYYVDEGRREEFGRFVSRMFGEKEFEVRLGNYVYLLLCNQIKGYVQKREDQGKELLCTEVFDLVSKLVIEEKEEELNSIIEFHTISDVTSL